MHRMQHDAPDVAELLLDLSYCLKVSCTVERVSAHEQELDEVAGDIPSSDVESPGEMGKSKAVIYRHNMCDTVSRVDDHTRRQTCRSLAWARCGS